MNRKTNNTSGKKKIILLAFGVFFIFSISFFEIYAQNNDDNKISLAVTPPLFQVSIEPGGRWVSSVKVVNGGKREIEIYATPVNFEARGEDGSARFIPMVEGGTGGVISAEWINISRGPYKVPAEGGVDIPFTVSVPDDATPGGHYSALLVGIEPADEQTQESVVRVSSLVSVLFLLRVEGDVVESGHIREFGTDSRWYDKPEARFVVTFENTGNVHLQPRGVIEIYNMWGNQRGVIPVNTRGQFGNVLPNSSRSFAFRWEGDGSLFEAGKYTANVTLAYGADGSRYVSETVGFWVLPIVPFLIVLGVILFLTLIFVGFIRFYVKRVLAYEKKRLGIEKERSVRTISIESLKAPIRDSVIDMKKGLKEEKEKGGPKEVLWKMISRYRLLVFVFFAVIFLGLCIYFFISVGTSSNFNFKIFEENPVGEGQSEVSI